MLSILTLTLSLLFSTGHAGQEIGNGGGGIKIDGRVVTVGTAKIEVRTSRLSQVPGMDLFLAEVNKWGLIGYDWEILQRAWAPYQGREFHKINLATVDQKQLQALKEEYAKVFGIPVSEVVIFALTDTIKRKTFLTEDFFRLTTTEQAAILFHEAAWILKPKAALDEVLELEVAMQNLLETGKGRIKTVDLLGRFLGELHLPTYLALAEMSDRSIRQLQIAELLDCAIAARKSGIAYPSPYSVKVCTEQWMSSIRASLTEKSPELLRILSALNYGTYEMYAMGVTEGFSHRVREGICKVGKVHRRTHHSYLIETNCGYSESHFILTVNQKYL